MGDEPQGTWVRLKQAARLLGIVGIAAANLALSYCSHTPNKPDSKLPDMRAPDAGVTDAAKPPDARLTDAAQADKKTTKPDARLWDVLCE
jgi:hypothetical protein